MTIVTMWWRAPVRRAVLAALAAALGARPALAQPRFFRSDDTLPVTLRTDLRALLHDRDTTKASLWREATLRYAGPDSQVTVPLRVRTRGIFRRANCDLPPVRLRFSDSTSSGTLFHGLRRPKLVNPCRNNAEYEQYLLEEYAIYRVLRLLTPVSLSARLVHITYEDASGRSAPIRRFAFVTEDPDRFAHRLGGTFRPRAQGIGLLLPPDLALLGVFQYFIGNTDWSVLARHNIELLNVRDTSRVVFFDFDWSGVIDPPYCRPNQILPTTTCRERIYRGFCQDSVELEPVLARFEALKDSIAAIYHSIPGLEPKSIEQTLRYYDEFYRAIGDRKRFMHDVIARDCRQ